MIIGKTQDLRRYKGLHKNIDKAIDYVLSTDLFSLPVGTIEVDGKNVFVLRQTYVAKALNDAKPESHRNYLDMQIVIKGSELFGYSHLGNKTAVVTEPYSDIKDVEKFTIQDETFVLLSEGSFAIVFPEDIHRPAVKLNDALVEKAVIKIKL
jgi:biofilm protein TabA